MDKTVLSLNCGWKFHLGECEDGWYKGFDDTAFRFVMLPHDWTVELPFSEKYSSGTGYLAGGIGWYRLHFTLPKEYQGKRIRLTFDGVYKNSQVWLNSYYLGKRPNGYVGFSYDVSDRVCFGEQENVVCVKVTHTDLADSRWYTGSGITKKVTLTVEEAVHPAENGSYLVTKSLASPDGQAAEIEIRHEVVNDAAAKRNVTVEMQLLTQEGTCVLALKKDVSLLPKETKIFAMEGVVSHPKLWSTVQPYLYRMQIWYCAESGERHLAEEQATGIRTAEFDAALGFFLNGVSTKLKGVCLHDDAGCLGAAVRPEVWQRRLAKLKGCGCNAIRCSHNPHMPELYDLCDRMGFLVMDEAFDEWENAKNKWSVGHNVYPPKHEGYFEDFPEWHEKDLKAMVRRDRRHPSVILWSIGNEIDYPNDPYCHPMFETMTGNNDADKPAAERRYDPNKPNAERMVALAAELSCMVKQEDGNRPVTIALAFPELSAKLGIFEALGVAGYNYKEHLYESDHAAWPDVPLLGSENGHSYAAWRTVLEHDYISGQFLWTGIDYLGEAHGWPIHGSAAGLLDCAGFEKDRYYQRKSFWSDEPVLHLSARRGGGQSENRLLCMPGWNYRPGEKVSVRCDSNLPEVRLLLNGTEIGRQTERRKEGGSYWFTVDFAAGTLTAEGYTADGTRCSTASLTPLGPAQTLRCTVWQQDDALTGTAWKQAAGQTGYLYQLEAELLDAQGQRTADDRLLRVHVEGPGVCAGLENGDLSDVTSYSLPERKTKQGRVIIYLKRTGAGKIKASLEADGLGGKGVEVEFD